MYETTDALFTGICDAIREKDGTTALISHQDIPARIAAISGAGEGFISPFYTYAGNGMKIENMVASDFNGYSAVFLSEPFLPGEATWEIQVKFEWPETQIVRSNTIFGSSNGYYNCPTIEIQPNGSLKNIWATVPDGAYGWNHQGGYTLQDDRTGIGWVRFRFDGEKYVVSLSEDGKMFEDVIQIDYGVMYQDVNNSKLQFGGINRSSNHYFEGSIDLKETYIKMGNEIWWGTGKEN